MGQGSSIASVSVKDLNDGDIVLIRTQVRTVLGQMDAGVLRAVAASQRSNHFSAQQQVLAGWSQCGMVLRHKDKVYLAMATMKGIELFPAGKHIRSIQKAGGRVAVRQLQTPFTPPMTRVIMDLLQAAVFGCEWDRYLPEISTDPTGKTIGIAPNQHMRLPKLPSAKDFGAPAATTAAGRVPPLPVHAAIARASESGVFTTTTASTRSDLTPWAKELIRLFIPRVWAALCSVPPSVEMELRRAFRAADTNGDGLVPASDVQAILQDFRGTAVSKPESESFIRLMDASNLDALTYDDFLAAMARRPMKEIPLEHDVHAILCGEFVATLYELLGLLPMRTATALRTPHTSIVGSRRPSISSPLAASPPPTMAAVSRHTPPAAPPQAGDISPPVLAAPTVLVDGLSAGAVFSADSAFGSCEESPMPSAGSPEMGKGLVRHVTSSDVFAAVKSPSNVMSRHAGKFESETTPAASELPIGVVPSAYDGTKLTPREASTIRPDGVEGIAATRPRYHPALSPSGHAAGSSGSRLPPTDPTRRGSAGSTTLLPLSISSPPAHPIKAGAATPHSTIVVIDSAVGDFRHFTPMSFSSLHEPKLALLRGRLGQEATIDVSSEELEAAHAREMVKAMTAGLRTKQMIVPPDEIVDIGVSTKVGDPSASDSKSRLSAGTNRV